MEQEYVQINPTRKREMAEAIISCQGDRRGFEFAEVIGVSKPMMSRLSTGNYTRPLPIDLLERIYNNKAEGCEVSLEQLIELNGMIPRERLNYNRMELVHAQDLREVSMRKAVMSELLEKGYSVKKINEQNRDSLGINLTRLHRTSFIVDDSFQWVFHINSSISSGEEDQMGTILLKKRMFERYSSWFLLDAWGSADLVDTKTSFIFIDGGIMENFVEAFSEAKTNTPMTVMLMDSDTFEIREERDIPSGKYTKDSPFNLTDIVIKRKKRED